MKSHDCHIFIKRLLPVALRALPDPIWKPLTELSQFFKELCLSTIRLEKVNTLEENIKLTLCKLERIFPPGFFNSMEHLPIHLAYEARVGGPVQYRWMYPFERFLHTLKKKVKSKSQVEGSICEAYITEEISTFCSHYFEHDVPSRRTRVTRNDDGVETHTDPTTYSIFNHPGCPSGEYRDRMLTDRELDRATLYVLLNFDEVQPYLDTYVENIRAGAPHLTDIEVDRRVEVEFPNWFKNYVHDPSNKADDQQIHDISWGPLRTVRTWHTYFVNGYRFDTDSWSQGKSTRNSGVCTRGTVYGQPEDDYHGILQEIIQLEYPGLPLKRLMLFNCEWFDLTLGRGTRIHEQFGMVEVRSTRRYNKYDHFILAAQAHQVYYAPYPSRHRNMVDWWVVIRIKARSVVDAPTSGSTIHAYQTDEEMPLQPTTVGDEHFHNLRDNDGTAEEIEVDNNNETFVIDDGDEDTNDQENEEEEDDEDTDEFSEDTDEFSDEESEYDFKGHDE